MLLLKQAYSSPYVHGYLLKYILSNTHCKLGRLSNQARTLVRLHPSSASYRDIGTLALWGNLGERRVLFSLSFFLLFTGFRGRPRWGLHDAVNIWCSARTYVVFLRSVCMSGCLLSNSGMFCHVLSYCHISTAPLSPTCQEQMWKAKKTRSEKRVSRKW